MSNATPASPASFGEMLKYVRKRAHLTQRDLGIAVGYSETYITRLENDTRLPDPIVVKAHFIDALGLMHEPQLAQRLIDLAEQTRMAKVDAGVSAIDARTNLPAPLTRFIGRQSELRSVIEHVQSHRLVTLTGSGGVGKTRLALEAGAQMLGHFKDGVQLAELAPLSDASLVAQNVAGMFKITNQAGNTYTDALKVLIGGRHLLLILDNCEHLIQACAELVEALLHACPRLHILATSREPINVAGECMWRVPSLCAEESAELFIERAQAVNSHFALNAENDDDVNAVCARLDGIPLAIELAASRLSALSVKQLASRLEDRYTLLTHGNRSALPRHQTLRALIAWSYDLLTDQERTLLRRLAVFAGGWTAEAAEAVCATPRELEDKLAALNAPNVLPLLISLVDKSLVIVSDDREQTRFTMLETIRQFAWEQLEQAGERLWVSDRHLKHFLNLAEQSESQPHLHVSAGRSKATLDCIQQDYGNMRAALDWTIAQQSEMFALRSCLALCPFWEARGYWSEGLNKLSEVLALIDEDTMPLDLRARYAQALMQSAILAWRQSEYATARRLFEASLSRFKACSDYISAGSALSYLGGVAYEQGDYVDAQSFYEKALAVWNALPDKPELSCSLTTLAIAGAIFNQGNTSIARQICEERLPFHRQHGEKYSLSYALNRLGTIHFMLDDLSTAKLLYEESLSLRRLLENKRGIAATANDLGNLHAALGDLETARALHTESLLVYQQLGNRRGMTSALSGLARLDVLDGNLHRGAMLISVVEKSLRTLHAALDEPAHSANERVVLQLQAQLDHAHYAGAWNEGAQLSLEQAVALALV